MSFSETLYMLYMYICIIYIYIYILYIFYIYIYVVNIGLYVKYIKLLHYTYMTYIVCIPSFLSYFKYLEEKILFWKQPSRFVLRTLQKNSTYTCKGVPFSVNLLLFLASKFAKMNFYTVIFKFFLFFFYL